MGIKIDSTMIITALAVVAGAYIYYNRKQLGDALNPVSDRNLAYRGVNGIGSALSGSQSWTLGGWIYDLTHKEYKP